jgi:hypothetical protein
MMCEDPVMMMMMNDVYLLHVGIVWARRMSCDELPFSMGAWG